MSKTCNLGSLIDKHAMINVIPARLEDVISYSDFDQEVPLKKILDQALLENSPDDSLLQDVLSGAAPINKTMEVHTISSGKCASFFGQGSRAIKFLTP